MLKHLMPANVKRVAFMTIEWEPQVQFVASAAPYPRQEACALHCRASDTALAQVCDGSRVDRTRASGVRCSSMGRTVGHIRGRAGIPAICGLVGLLWGAPAFALNYVDVKDVPAPINAVQLVDAPAHDELVL